METQYIDTLFNILASQRNTALDSVAKLSAEIVILKQQIEQLQQVKKEE
jgi:hypothetical protein